MRKNKNVISIDIWPPKSIKSQFFSTYYDNLAKKTGIDTKFIQSLHIRGISKIPFIFGAFNDYTVNMQRRKKALLHIMAQTASVKTWNPYILTFLDTIQFKSQTLLPQKPLRYSLERMRECAIHADKIITISNTSKNDLVHDLAIDNNKIEVIYPGIDLNIFKKTVDKDKILQKYGFYSDKAEKNVLFVGADSPRKNLKTLIESINIVKNNYNINKIKLYVISKLNNANKKKMLNIIESKNLASNVHLLGRVPLSDLILLYSKADVFVLPTLAEGFGLPNVEAQACGCPVISSNITVIREVLGNSAHLIDPLNPLEIAHAILNILSDKSYRKLLIERGKRNALRFSMQLSVEKTVDIHRQVYYRYF